MARSTLKSTTGTAAEHRRRELELRMAARRQEVADAISADADIRNRAAVFATAWKDVTSEKSEAKSFWDGIFTVLGLDRFASGVQHEFPTHRHSTKGQKNRGLGYIDTLWPGRLLVEQKSAGKDLQAALVQADDYELSPDEQPRLTVVSDFQRFLVRDNHIGTIQEFPLSQLVENLGAFGPLVNDEVTEYHAGELVSMEAAEKMASLFDSLRASGYEGHALRVFLVRILFCLFADDTRIWKAGIFEDYVKEAPAPRWIGPMFAQLFDVLNTPTHQRQSALDPSLAVFPYVNGGVFAENIGLPNFDQEMVDLLLDCSAVDWTGVSPAIFGSLFQGVMDANERHSLGAHYTSEKNILKVIEPLFLDELRASLDTADTLQKLENVWDRLADIKIFDPAAGCGNFLIVAYRELRRVERDLLHKIRNIIATGAPLSPSQSRRYQWALPLHQQMVLDTGALSRLSVAQCHAIEIDEWPAKIAEVALYLVDHLANMELEAAFGGNQAKLPLSAAPTIIVGNALRVDWNSVLPAGACSYVLGNPPFLGMGARNDEQRSDMLHVFGTKMKAVNSLDYVTCWFKKAADYVQGTSARVAFVSTNSISQGEQPPVLWGHLYELGMKIDFAHRSFNWSNEARGNAAVHVIITGFSEGGQRKEKLLYSYAHPKAEPTVTKVTAIGPYLVPGSETLVTARSTPLSAGAPKMARGSMPTDGGHLILSPEEAAEVRTTDPIAAKYLRRLYGAQELIQSKERWCLWLKDAEVFDLRSSPVLRDRATKVAAFRAASKAPTTRNTKVLPTTFMQVGQPTTEYLCVPGVSSEARRYLPTQFFSPDTVPTNKVYVVTGAQVFHFGVLNSSVFMAWLRTITGRMKSDFSLSSDTVYHNFSWPVPDEAERNKIETLAQAVLDVRKQHPTASLADLYDPLAMPAVLVKAHDALDRAVLKAYGLPANAPEEKILVELFARYEALIAAEKAAAAAPVKRKRTGSTVASRATAVE